MLSHLLNVAILDDHTLFRKILKHFLSEQPNINVVLQSADMPDLISRLNDTQVQILVMDLLMPKPGGIEAVKTIRNQYPEIKILILSMCSDIELLSELLDLGVYGILSKADDPDELIRAILSLSEHRIYRSKLFTEVMYWSKQSNVSSSGWSQDISLNDRERKILQLLWDEKSNREIADQLFLSVRSVEKLRQDLKEKVGVKSTVGLLKHAINKGIISISSQVVNHFPRYEKQKSGMR